MDLGSIRDPYLAFMLDFGRRRPHLLSDHYHRPRHRPILPRSLCSRPKRVSAGGSYACKCKCAAPPLYTRGHNAHRSQHPPRP
ncbi:hypothetical protein PsYK624_114210 [Phanerochaete sordida]|uniref:Uncharacterized protein n=1 Tax=Phanerochaete sordida TaxID=48140 RepID=A0A9P3GKN6_9APHY|nr:hypothetical protein PsYK624_114210 [Phanerochaete sordida]